MAFNHYAKIARILARYPGWYVVIIHESTTARKFNGELTHYDHYYRVYSADGQPIKYCKFQQLDRFALALSMTIEDIPLIE